MCRQVGQLVKDRSSTRKQEATNGNAICCPILEWTLDRDNDVRIMYLSLVQDQGPKPTQLPPLNEPTPEQAFLKNYDENARRAFGDPCGIFRTPTGPSAAPAVASSGP